MTQITLKTIFANILLSVFVLFLGILFQTELQELVEVLKRNPLESFIVIALCIIMFGVYKPNFQQE